MVSFIGGGNLSTRRKSGHQVIRIVLWVYESIKSRIFKYSSYLIFQMFSEDINTFLKSIMSLFKVDNCFTIWYLNIALWFDWFDLLCFSHFQQYFSYIKATSFSRGRSRREPPTMGKQLVTFTFCNLQSRARAHGVLVIGLYELLGNPTI